MAGQARVRNRKTPITKYTYTVMAEYTSILCAEANSTLTITLNRPESYNAINETMKNELNDVFRRSEKDETVRCIVLRGAGEKAFCSGQDLKERNGSRRSLKESLEKSYNPLIRKMRSIEKPVIGMINGVAAGAGLSIALACDMRIMADTAKLIEVFIRIGLIPDSGSHWFLPRLAGMARAFEYAATGRDIDAAEAERAGLVNRVVAASELEPTVTALAEKLAKAPTRSIGLIKRALNKSLASDLDSLLAYEAVLQEIASRTDDYHEGVNAFLEKREAVFRGK